MVSRKANVVHVELAEPYEGRRNWYFSSIAAIYERLPKDIVGVTKEHLWRVFGNRNEYTNRKATIRRAELVAKAHAP
jgi:hypothetical protein